MQQGHAAGTVSKNMQHEHAARTCGMNMQQGHAGLHFKDMQQGHNIKRAFDAALT
jgi:hypothetical protein